MKKGRKRDLGAEAETEAVSEASRGVPEDASAVNVRLELLGHTT